METPEKRLLDIGLDPKFVKETLKNEKICSSLLRLLDSLSVNIVDKKIGNMLYNVASTLPDYLEHHKSTLGKYIIDGKINSQHKLSLAYDYVKKNKEISIEEFEKACGVGIETTNEEVLEAVNALLTNKDAELQEMSYSINISGYLSALKEKLPFADQACVVKVFNEALEKKLGPRNKDQKKKKPVAKPESTKVEEEEEKPKKRIECLTARDLESCQNSAENLKKHIEFTGGKVITRFPPEPNGYLHIGHAKAMRFSFMTAKENGGETYLRFDDTNPEKETKEYIDNIFENVSWLGYKPWKVTHASENFQKLYEYAIELIKKGKAYVCFMKKEQLREFRKDGKPSPYRDTSVTENLAQFDLMKKGFYEEGVASLRLKIDMNHPNFTMRDPVAYRIRYVPHPHAGSEWCIYPCYDFTHCICDSLENITHSLCTLEFEIRRDLYYWVLKELDIFRPNVWEYSRLNISNNVLSKRKLLQMLEKKIVFGWDDPRMLTLNGLRRRGYTADSINDFCDLVSVTRRGNENFIDYSLLQHCLRKDLDAKAKRTMAVLNPVQLLLVNVPDNFEKIIEVSDYPKNPEKGHHQIKFTNKIFVEENDVKAEDVKGFFGIAPGKLVMLKYASPIKILEVLVSKDGKPEFVKAELIEDPNIKVPKGVLHWISQSDSIECEVRLYENLFNLYNPNELENFLDAINPNSLTIIRSKVNKDLTKLRSCEQKFQFERLGFFSPDFDCDFENGKLVFNRTIPLDDKGKQKVLGEKEVK